MIDTHLAYNIFLKISFGYLFMILLKLSNYDILNLNEA